MYFVLRSDLSWCMAELKLKVKRDSQKSNSLFAAQTLVCFWVQLSSLHASCNIFSTASLSVSSLSSPASLFYLLTSFTLALPFFPHCNWHFALNSFQKEIANAFCRHFTSLCLCGKLLSLRLTHKSWNLSWFLEAVCTFSAVSGTWILVELHVELNAIMSYWVNTMQLFFNCVCEGSLGEHIHYGAAWWKQKQNTHLFFNAEWI